MTRKSPTTRRSLLSVYLVWLVVFATAFAAGGYTLGFFVDVESLGTGNSPNTLQAAGNFVEITTSNNGGNNGNTGRITIAANNANAGNTENIGKAGNNAEPSARFTYAGNDGTYRFDATESSDPDGSIVSFEWYFANDGDFGNQPDATGQTIDRSLSMVDIVRLLVTDNDGATNSTAKPLDP